MEMNAPKFPSKFSVRISEEGKRIPEPLKTLSWSCRHVKRYEVKAMKEKDKPVMKMCLQFYEFVHLSPALSLKPVPLFQASAALGSVLAF